MARISVRVLEAACEDGVDLGALYTYLVIRQLVELENGVPQFPRPTEIIRCGGQCQKSVWTNLNLLRATRLLSPEWIMDPEELRKESRHQFFAVYDMQILRRIRNLVRMRATIDFVFLLTFTHAGKLVVRRADTAFHIQRQFRRSWKGFQEQVCALQIAGILTWHKPLIRIDSKYLVPDKVAEPEPVIPDAVSEPASPRPAFVWEPGPSSDISLDPEETAFEEVLFQDLIDQLDGLAASSEPDRYEKQNVLIACLNRRIGRAKRLQDVIPWVAEEKVAANMARWFPGWDENQVRDLDQFPQYEDAVKHLGRPLNSQEESFFYRRFDYLQTVLPSKRALISIDVPKPAQEKVPIRDNSFPLTAEQTKFWEGYIVETWARVHDRILAPRKAMTLAKPNRVAAKALVSMAEQIEWALNDPDPEIISRLKRAWDAVTEMAAQDFQAKGDRRKGFGLHWVANGFDRYRSELEDN